MGETNNQGTKLALFISYFCYENVLRTLVTSSGSIEIVLCRICTADTGYVCVCSLNLRYKFNYNTYL